VIVVMTKPLRDGARMRTAAVIPRPADTLADVTTDAAGEVGAGG
jgi:hypothetical protein